MSRPPKPAPKPAPTAAARLRSAVETARLPGSPKDAVERTRRLLLAFMDASLAQGRTAAELADDLATGQAALTLARVELAQTPDDPTLSCASGCAFCCILPGDDGGLITEVEARNLHAALAPRAGQPDGRDWHPRACPALDPDTQACRAYEARPVICRAYVSRDVKACEDIADGTSAGGAGVLGPHVTYLLAHGLARAALKGTRLVQTYALASIAASAVAGLQVEAAVTQARHRPRDLDAERRRSAKGYASGKYLKS